MKDKGKVYHYIGLSEETTMRLRRHILDTFKTSKLLSETIERYIIAGLAHDATPAGKRALREMVDKWEDRKLVVADARTIAVRKTAAKQRREKAKAKTEQ